MTLDRQAFLGLDRPTPERFDPATNPSEHGIVAKPEGGLWTSTLYEGDDGPTCAWVEWCRREQFGPLDEAHLYALDPVDDVTVVEIDGPGGIRAVLDEYGRDLDVPPVWAAFDFEAMRADGVDAVHVTAEGERMTRFTTPGLYGWDCESTAWLSWSFESVEDLGPIRS